MTESRGFANGIETTVYSRKRRERKLNGSRLKKSGHCRVTTVIKIRNVLLTLKKEKKVKGLKR